MDSFHSVHIVSGHLLKPPELLGSFWLFLPELLDVCFYCTNHRLISYYGLSFIQRLLNIITLFYAPQSRKWMVVLNSSINSLLTIVMSSLRSDSYIINFQSILNFAGFNSFYMQLWNHDVIDVLGGGCQEMLNAMANNGLSMRHRSNLIQLIQLI